MRKTNLEFKLPVSIIREGKKYIAYTPALDLSTFGKSYEEAKKRFLEIVSIFLEELIQNGSFEEALFDLGWERFRAKWNPISLQPYRLLEPFGLIHLY